MRVLQNERMAWVAGGFIAGFFYSKLASKYDFTVAGAFKYLKHKLASLGEPPITPEQTARVQRLEPGRSMVEKMFPMMARLSKSCITTIQLPSPPDMLKPLPRRRLAQLPSLSTTEALRNILRHLRNLPQESSRSASGNGGEDPCTIISLCALCQVAPVAG